MVGRKKLAVVGNVLCSVVIALLVLGLIARMVYGKVFVIAPRINGADDIKKYHSVRYKVFLSRRLHSPELFAFLYPQILSPSSKMDDIISLGVPMDGRPKIVVLGGSVTCGEGIDDKTRVFSGLLQQKMPDHQVLNFARKGYNIYQIHSMFDHAFALARPSFVIYHYADGDAAPMVYLENPRRRHEYNCCYPDFLYHGLKNGKVLSGICYPLYRWSTAYRLFLFRFGMKLKLRGLENESSRQAYFERCFNVLVRDMGELCRRSGTVFIVLTDVNASLTEERLRSSLGQLLQGCPVDVVRIIPMPRSAYADMDHFNVRGHTLMAEQVYTIVQQERGHLRKNLGPNSDHVP